MIGSTHEAELELGLPTGTVVEDGEWVLAIFELGIDRRATSAAARASLGPDGTRLVFEPRDFHKLFDFMRGEVRRRSTLPPEPSTSSDSTSSRTAIAPSAPVPRTPTLPAHSEISRILVVDDDPDIRDVVSAMLEAVGLVVAAVESAEEALVFARRETFDLLVLDWNLPQMSGIDLCRIIRQDPTLSTLPVLFLTANSLSQEMVDAFASGADDFVTKPFRAPELGARIFSLLRRAKMLGG